MGSDRRSDRQSQDDEMMKAVNAALIDRMEELKTELTAGKKPLQLDYDSLVVWLEISCAHNTCCKTYVGVHTCCKIVIPVLRNSSFFPNT